MSLVVLLSYCVTKAPRAIDFTITHGKGRKGIIIRTKKQSPLKKVLTFLKSRRVWK